MSNLHHDIENKLRLDGPAMSNSRIARREMNRENTINSTANSTTDKSKKDKKSK
jgi:hypothetical protein